MRRAAELGVGVGLLDGPRVFHLLHLLKGRNTMVQMLLHHEVNYRFGKELLDHSALRTSRAEMFYQLMGVFYSALLLPHCSWK